MTYSAVFYSYYIVDYMDIILNVISFFAIYVTKVLYQLTQSDFAEEKLDKLPFGGQIELWAVEVGQIEVE